MKKLLMLIFTLLLLAACSRDEEKEVVVVGTNAEYPPFEYLVGNEIAGIDADIIEEISQRTGITFQWSNIAFDSLIPSMQMGKLDMIIACMTVTPERAKNVDFSIPYLASPITVIVNEEAGTLSSMDDLAGKRFGAQLGTTQEAKAQSIEGSTVISYPQPSAAILDLLSDKLDAVVVDESVGLQFVEKNKGLKVLGVFEGDHKAIAVSKNKKELLHKVDTALEEMLEDGTIQKILDKYL